MVRSTDLEPHCLDLNPGSHTTCCEALDKFLTVQASLSSSINGHRNSNGLIPVEGTSALLLSASGYGGVT